MMQIGDPNYREPEALVIDLVAPAGLDDLPLNVLASLAAEIALEGGHFPGLTNTQTLECLRDAAVRRRARVIRDRSRRRTLNMFVYFLVPAAVAIGLMMLWVPSIIYLLTGTYTE